METKPLSYDTNLIVQQSLCCPEMEILIRDEAMHTKTETQDFYLTEELLIYLYMEVSVLKYVKSGGCSWTV